MYMIQLFDEADEVHPIDARLVREGVITIGRDSAADWPIVDPQCELSRAHCELEVADGELRLRALGRNGVFDALDGSRFPDAVAVSLSLPSTVRLGRYRLKATRDSHGYGGGDMTRTLVLTPPLSSTAVPRDWADAAPPAPAATGSLLDAFCEGAGLDVSMLASKDGAETMRRAGAIYRQMILGISDLMAERDQARGKYQMCRTTIGGTNNNPFKWAPTQRLAIDLLLGEKASFLSGAEALQASFRDIKRHLIATFAGLHGSLRAAIDAFDPATIEREAAARASFLKGRAAAGMEQVALVHADLRRQLDEGEGGALERAFVAAYDRQDAEDPREDEA
ncbi:MAG: type VI secretion system-associated FHA domain protein TagH [Sphingomonadales bacterium]|nr:type VI secretion system-associated FHA domain protein TagH [Sphingomonadales bacterium]